MAEKTEDLNLPLAVVTRIIRDAVSVLIRTKSVLSLLDIQICTLRDVSYLEGGYPGIIQSN